MYKKVDLKERRHQHLNVALEEKPDQKSIMQNAFDELISLVKTICF
jgi:hypothetical protein